MTSFMIGLIGLLLMWIIVVPLYKKKRRNQLTAPVAAAGMNFDLESVQPFLNRLSYILDSSFTDDELHSIQTSIERMSKDHEEKDLGTYSVIYHGENMDLRIEAEIHIEDGSKEVVLNLFSEPELVQVIEEEMMRYADELGV